MLTVFEAANLLDSSSVYVRRLIRLKKISAYKHGRDWAIDKESVLAYAKIKRASRH